MVDKTIKTYSELIKIDDYYKRFEYLRLGGKVGEDTFGFDRWLNQKFYTSDPWKSFRNEIILRDQACDMAFITKNGDYEIKDRLIVHHLNAITREDIINRSPSLFDPENVVCVSDNTHKAIHYGNVDLLPKPIVIRTMNDTCPWKK